MTEPTAPPSPAMEHPFIDDEAIVERYHQGSLSAADEAAFEEHYVGCAVCQEELALHRSFQRGLRTMAAEDLARVQLGFLGLVLSTRLRRGVAFAAVLAVAATPAFLLWRRGEGWAERGREAEGKAGALAERLAEVERQASESRAELEERLERALADAGRLTAPLADLPVFLLRTYRDSSAAPTTIDAGAERAPLALAVDVGLAPAADRYRVVLRSGDGAVLFERDDLRPNALDVLLVAFPADFLPTGDLEIEVVGIRGRERVEVGRFPIRIVRRAGSAG